MKRLISTLAAFGVMTAAFLCSGCGSTSTSASASQTATTSPTPNASQSSADAVAASQAAQADHTTATKYVDQIKQRLQGHSLDDQLSEIVTEACRDQEPLADMSYDAWEDVWQGLRGLYDTTWRAGHGWPMGLDKAMKTSYACPTSPPANG